MHRANKSIGHLRCPLRRIFGCPIVELNAPIVQRSTFTKLRTTSGKKKNSNHTFQQQRQESNSHMAGSQIQLPEIFILPRVDQVHKQLVQVNTFQTGESKDAQSNVPEEMCWRPLKIHKQSPHKCELLGRRSPRSLSRPWIHAVPVVS